MCFNEICERCENRCSDSCLNCSFFDSCEGCEQDCTCCNYAFENPVKIDCPSP